jgi:beta-1,4-mannosyltransferase
LKDDLKSVESFLPQAAVPESTYFTLTDGLEHKLRNNRPAIIVSSTSWTEDEDFSILIDALSAYELAARKSSLVANTEALPRILVVVTGKGHLKEYYMEMVESRTVKEEWSWVRCIAMWLSTDDYPKFLGIVMQNT